MAMSFRRQKNDEIALATVEKSAGHNAGFNGFLLLLCIVLLSSSNDTAVLKNARAGVELFVSNEQLLPLADAVPRQILNPYFSEPAWKLWSKDPEPVLVETLYLTGSFKLVDKAEWVFPVFSPDPGVPVELKKQWNSSMSGFFDEVYLSLDNGHTNLGYPPAKYFINAGKIPTANDAATRFKLGVNFTSQSYAGLGREIVDDTFNNLNTEKNFFFANCIRATPGHTSYADVKEDGVTDYYDALHSHSIHSVGQSGSEVNALSKMMIAGASMPRDIKDRLKLHGVYASSLLTIYKLALPYASASGETLPYEHELRHRPVYSANGDPLHKHFCAANVYYHGYDEKRHLWEMARLSMEMPLTPPVALLKIAGLLIQRPKGSSGLNAAETAMRLKSAGLTAIRIWGEPGDTIEVLADLRSSYDLQGQELSFSCRPLYPNQRNIAIDTIERGLYLVRVTHDPQLPKGRIPVICTARNHGELPSNPVFINFYWPEENELVDYGQPSLAGNKAGSDTLKKKTAVDNKRPKVIWDLQGDSFPCRPGESVEVKLQAKDPEGYSVETFKWLNEWGTITDGTYRVTIPSTASPHIEPVRFIFSDGTGGYSSKQLKLLVGKTPDTLEPPWALSLLGRVPLTAFVMQEGNNFEFRGMDEALAQNQQEGLFVLQKISGDTDIAAEIPQKRQDAAIGLLMTNSLDDHSRKAYVGLVQNKVYGLLRPREQQWGTIQAELEESFQVEPRYFRISTRNGHTGVYVSSDSWDWVQLIENRIDWFENIYAGILYSGGKTAVEAKWIEPTGGVGLIHMVNPKTNKAGNLVLPLKLGISLPPGFTGRYSINNIPQEKSLLLAANVIELTTEGRHELRVYAYNGEALVGTTTAVYSIVAQ
jgi:hypothetical protein